ncbi:hypothetical protein ACN47E_005640 [Coniothyrium glycines]
MEEVVFTPRLKLTLVTCAEQGSQEFEWLHELRSDEKASWWSIFGRSTSREQTEKQISSFLPMPPSEGAEKTYRIVYAVHELRSTTETSESDDASARFVGLITVRSLELNSFPIPASMFPASSAPSATTLNVELGYSFLPTSWGKGIATESVNAVFAACRRAPSFWAPFERVYIRAFINSENAGSLRVMAKTDMEARGVHVWVGEPVWLAGAWHERSELPVFGMFLKE